MPKITIFVLALFCHFFVYSQTEVKDLDIEQLYSSRDFDAIIELSKSDLTSLNAESLFLIGMSYYNFSQDENALTYFDQAVNIDDSNAEYHFYKGISYLFLNELPKAETCLKKATEIEKENALFVVALGDAYFNSGAIDLALECYLNAQSLIDCPDRAYIMYSQILMDQNKYTEALASYKIALTTVDPFYSSFIDCLYNIGLLEYQLEQFENAQASFERVVELRPLDYQAMSKIIQCHYANSDFEKSIYWKKRIYDGYNIDALPKDMRDMFCFDQFSWNGNKIMAYERYSEPPNSNFHKHIFYVISELGKVDFSVQTEHSLTISNLDKHYVLSKSDNNGQSSYFDCLFDKEVNYTALKKSVIDIFEENITPYSEIENFSKKKRKNRKRKKKA